jgi:hypothetical protein
LWPRKGPKLRPEFCHLDFITNSRQTTQFTIGSCDNSIKMEKAAKEAMAASYKSLKEDFVSGLTGGSISEINLVTIVAPVRTSTLYLIFAHNF